MILTCPSCEARFNIKPEVLLPNGRSVRCSKCAHTWKELPPQDMPKRVVEEESELVVPIPDNLGSDSNYEDIREEAAPEESADLEESSIESADSDAPSDNNFMLPASEPRDRTHGPQRQTKSHDSNFKWVGLVAVLGIIFGGAFFGRAVIIDIWPPASMLYGIAGLGQEPGYGLELRNVSPAQEREGDTVVLVISGEIANTTSRPRKVPMLQGKLLDESKNEIYSWTFSVAVDQLEPGDSGSFNTRLLNPPEDASGLAVTFVQSQEG